MIENHFNSFISHTCWYSKSFRVLHLSPALNISCRVAIKISEENVATHQKNCAMDDLMLAQQKSIFIEKFIASRFCRAFRIWFSDLLTRICVDENIIIIIRWVDQFFGRRTFLLIPIVGKTLQTVVSSFLLISFSRD